jgi:hypothetical protein
LEDLFLLSSSHTIVFPSRFSSLLPIGPSYLPTLIRYAIYRTHANTVKGILSYPLNIIGNASKPYCYNAMDLGMALYIAPWYISLIQWPILLYITSHHNATNYKVWYAHILCSFGTTSIPHIANTVCNIALRLKGPSPYSPKVGDRR